MTGTLYIQSRPIFGGEDKTFDTCASTCTFWFCVRRAQWTRYTATVWLLKVRRCHHRTCSIRRAPHKPGIKTRRSGDDFSPYSASTAAQTYSVRVQHCSCHYTVHLHRRIMFDHLWPTYASTSINRGLVIFHVYLPSDLTAPPKWRGYVEFFSHFSTDPLIFFWCHTINITFMKYWFVGAEWIVLLLHRWNYWFIREWWSGTIVLRSDLAARNSVCNVCPLD